MVTRTDNVLQLVISDIKPSDSGDYVCKSHSEIGQNETTGSIKVDCKYLCVCACMCEFVILRL
jgi:hypothetical protein